jgi:hypothetical protein
MIDVSSISAGHRLSAGATSPARASVTGARHAHRQPLAPRISSRSCCLTAPPHAARYAWCRPSARTLSSPLWGRPRPRPRATSRGDEDRDADEQHAQRREQPAGRTAPVHDRPACGQERDGEQLRARRHGALLVPVGERRAEPRVSDQPVVNPARAAVRGPRGEQNERRGRQARHDDPDECERDAEVGERRPEPASHVNASGCRPGRARHRVGRARRRAARCRPRPAGRRSARRRIRPAS